MPRMSSVRRLHLEAYTLAMAELKRSIEAPSNEARKALSEALLSPKGLHGNESHGPRPFKAFKGLRRPSDRCHSRRERSARMLKDSGFVASTLRLAGSEERPLKASFRKL